MPHAPHVSPKASRLIRNALRGAVARSWSAGSHPEDRPAIEQDAQDTRRKLVEYIAELERDRHTLRNIAKGTDND